MGLALTANVDAPPGALVLNLPELGFSVNTARQHPTAPDDGLEGIQFIEVAMYRAQDTFTRDPDQPIRRDAPPLQERRDGNLLATLKSLEGTPLRLPSDRKDWPDPALLEQRFTRFLSGAYPP